MIHFLDTFIDSKAKRYAIFRIIGWTLITILLLTFLMCGIALFRVKNATELQALLGNDFLKWNYVVRFARLLIYQEASLKTFFKSIIDAIGLLEWLIIIWLIVCDKKSLIKTRNTFFIWFFYLEVIGCMIVLLTLPFAQNYQEILSRIHICGIIITICTVLQMMFTLIRLVYSMKAYCHALDYKVIEIKEHD